MTTGDGRITLRTLGPVGLTRPDGSDISAVLSQPKRLALLVYLAVANHGALCRRDSVLGVFWPEFDQDRARAALRKALHFLRRELGEGVIVARGDEEIGVDPARLSCDANEFDTATRTSRWADCLEMYAGEFLAGFHVGIVEFERWRDEMAERLRRDAVRAAEQLTQDAMESDDRHHAARWADVWTRLAPYDEIAARALMSALASAGDRPGAFQAFESLARRLRELEIQPSEETVELATSIRGPSTDASPAPRVRVQSLNPRPRFITRSVGAALLSVAALVIAFRTGRSGEMRLDLGDPPVVRVQSFRNVSGDPTIDRLGEVMGRAAATAAAELEGVEVVPFGSASSSATMIVTGSYLRVGDSIEVRPEIVDHRSSRILPAPRPIRAALGDQTSVLHQLSSRVTGAVAFYTSRLGETRCHARSPPSYEAFSAFQGGWPGTFTDQPPDEEARALLKDALAADPTYTEAWYGVAETFGQVYHVPWDSLAREMRLAIDQLTPLDRAVLDLFDASAQLHLTEALAHRVRIAQCIPDAWIGVAVLAQWTNHPALALEALRQVDDRPWLTQLPAYWAVYTTALQLGDHETELEALAEGARRRQPGSQDQFLIGEWPLFPKIALHDVGAVQQYIDHADSGAVGIFALEMRAHGLEEQSRALLARAVERHLADPEDPGDPTFSRQRQRLKQDVGYALQLMNRSDEAIALLEPWTRVEMASIADLIAQISHPMENPVGRVLGGRSPPAVDRGETWKRLRQPLSLLGQLGMAYARNGDRAAATQIADRFAALNEDDLIFPYVPDLYRARIYAQLGDRADAVKLLDRAFVKGLPFYRNFAPAQDQIFWHADPAFEPLHGYQPYEDLVAPREWNQPK